MSNFIKDQEFYSDIINCIGGTKIENDQTINEILTINGVNLWLAASPEMAWRHLVNIVESKSFFQNLKTLLKPNYHKLKLRFNPPEIQISPITSGFTRSTKNIISLGFSPKMHSDVIEPVINNFKESDDIKVYKLSNFKQRINTLNIRYRTRDEKTFLINKLKKKKATLKKLNDAKKLLFCSEAYNNLLTENKFGIDSTNIKRLFDLFFRSLAPSILLHSLQVEAILKQIKPVCVISPDTSDFKCRVVSMLAKKYNIPTYEIQFGLTGPEAIEWRYFISSRVAVWGKQAESILISHGVPKPKIAITGSPRHDSVIRTLKSSECAEVGPRTMKVLFASTYTDPAHKIYCPPQAIFNMKKSVFDALKYFDNIELLIKLHPMEDSKDIKTLLSSYNGQLINVVLVEGIDDISELIKECDAFISFGSSATLDALIAGKKVGTLCFDGWNFSGEILENLPVIKLNNTLEVKNFIRKITENNHSPFQTEELKRIQYLALTDGPPSVKVYRDICNLIQNW